MVNVNRDCVDVSSRLASSSVSHCLCVSLPFTPCHSLVLEINSVLVCMLHYLIIMSE